MWFLLQMLPFLVGDLIDKKSRHWQLFILLREICIIVFAPIVTTTHYRAPHIIQEAIWSKFNTQTPIYARIVVMFGPLSQLWCMRFEAKHNPLKRHAHVVGKNICKTLSYKHQVQPMYSFKFGDALSEKVSVSNAYSVSINSLKKLKTWYWKTWKK